MKNITLPDKTLNANQQFACETFAAEGARIDAEGGSIFEALAFGPKTMVGPYYQGASGLYSRGFFASLTAAIEGAYCWAKHPDKDQYGNAVPRDAKDAIARWTQVKESADQKGNPEVRGKWTLRKKSKEDYDVVLESPRSFAFSIFAPVKTKHDSQYGQIIDAVATESPWRPSVDLVEAGGANKNAIEAASQPQPTNKQESTMEAAEIQALIDKAVAGAQSSAKAEFTSELAKMKRTQLVQEKLAAAKVSKVSEGTLSVLQTMPEDKIDGFIAEQAKLLADLADAQGKVVTNQGHAQEDNQKNASFTCEVVGPRSMTGMVMEMAGRGFATDASKDKAFAKQWVDRIGRRISNFADKTEETKKLRTMIQEKWALSGIRSLFTQMYGFTPSSPGEVGNVIPNYTDSREINAAEAAIDNTGFTALNNTVLASIIINAYNATGGLVADQLMMPYPTNHETENVPGFNEPTGIDVYAENAAKPDTAITNKYVTLQKLSKIGGRVFLTREAVFYDQTGLLLQRANTIGSQIALHREHILLAGIADTSSYTPVATPVTTFAYYPSGSRTSLWTGVNTFESNALVDYSNIEKAINNLRKQTDSRGERLSDNNNTPYEILLPGDLEVTAQKIFTATNLETNPGGANNTRFNNPYSNIRVYVSNVLNSINPNTWYIAGAGGFSKQFIRKITFPLEVVPLPAAEVTTVTNDRVAGVAVMFAERCFAVDNKRVVRNTTGAMS